MKRAVFLDRDGVLNVDLAPYVTCAEDLRIFPFVGECLGLLANAGFELFVVSNQQGVAKGITPPEELPKMNAMLRAVAAEHGAEIREIYYCTAHRSENHPWRKPSPGMLLSAAEQYGVDLSRSFLIGDKWSDIEAGARAGVTTVLVLTGVTNSGWEQWDYRPDHVCESLVEAVEWVVGAGR